MMLLSQKKKGRKKETKGGGEALGSETRNQTPTLSLSLTHAALTLPSASPLLPPPHAESPATAATSFAGEPRRDHGSPLLATTTPSPPLSSPRTQPVSGTSGGLEAPPTCRNPATHHPHNLFYKLEAKIEPQSASISTKSKTRVSGF